MGDVATQQGTVADRPIAHHRIASHRIAMHALADVAAEQQHVLDLRLARLLGRLRAADPVG
jgi:hypothetical protein